MRCIRLGRRLSLLAFSIGISASAEGAPIIESSGRLEVNWSSHRVRFFGEAQASSSDGEEALKAAEKKAWQEGLSYVSDAVRDLNVAANESLVGNGDSLSQRAKEAAKQIASSTFSYNTTYFGDGTVRVHLENALPKALEVGGVRFRQKEALQASMTQFSGLVFKLESGVRPRANYAVVDEAGEVLFSIHDMAEEAYRRGLMGRWFRRPTQAELAEVVGKNPTTLAVRPEAEGERLVVRRAEWDRAVEGHGALLVNGAIALTLP